MSKTSIELLRHAVNGPTMGTRWSALFHMTPGYCPQKVQKAFQTAVDEVDAQMSTWRPDSDLMRLNAAPVGEWINVPQRLLEVLLLSLEIGRASSGAFEIGMGDAVRAWGFGPSAADQVLIRKALNAARRPSHETLDVDPDRGAVRKTFPVTLDLNGIAKGYGVDRLADVLKSFDIPSGLVGIDGEMRAIGLRPDGEPWAIAIEAPDRNRRTPHSVLALQDASVATSGDYRHWLSIQGRCLSHTMDPHCGAPLMRSPASVTVVAQTCAQADAWATALMVLGAKTGCELAQHLGLDALFLLRDTDETIRAEGVGSLFAPARTR